MRWCVDGQKCFRLPFKDLVEGAVWTCHLQVHCWWQKHSKCPIFHGIGNSTAGCWLPYITICFWQAAVGWAEYLTINFDVKDDVQFAADGKINGEVVVPVSQCQGALWTSQLCCRICQKQWWFLNWRILKYRRKQIWGFFSYSNEETIFQISGIRDFSLWRLIYRRKLTFVILGFFFLL